MAFNFAPFTGVGNPILPPLTKLTPGQYLKSPSQQYQLILQNDGSLVIYNNGVAVWSAQERETYFKYSIPAEDRANNYIATQYYFRFNDATRNRLWLTTNTSPLGGNINLAYFRTYLSLQDDGNLVMNDCFPLWASNSSIEAFSLYATDMVITPGQSLVQGQVYQSGVNRVIFQADGNLVIYAPNNAVLWQSATQGATQALMQTDGNFVIYNGATVLFQTGTGGNPGAYARIQSNGTFSVAIDKAVWARFGFTPVIAPRRKWKQWGPYTLPEFTF
ncbi:putidacin L1 family lectin-like bacteriocin [Pseudomonas putida]|uniref:putidacin L1 family lectin-like bacteriocin n=1 Tax=Pseudomonas putida TaxID=303 RepID=UPI00236369AD|nr:putidacin L1 family lectin-like bacteriocin [Pseudomonas putida]MDD1966172.1 putidacin L1 family lectin-like bacteriocin [Pseudomonas putida]